MADELIELSQDTSNVLEYLDGVSDGGLRKRNDLGALFELTARRGAAEEMNDLLFNGTHTYQIFHTLRRAGQGAEGFDTLEREFKESVDRLRDQLAKALIDAPEEIVERFNDLYYQMTQGSLRNLVDLAHDLRLAKKVQNEHKYGGG